MKQRYLLARLAARCRNLPAEGYSLAELFLTQDPVFRMRILEG